MIEPTVIAALRQRIAVAHAPLASVVVRCQEQAERTSRLAERIVEHVGVAKFTRETATASERHPRVVEAFQRREFGHLSFGDRRYAAKRFEDATPGQMQALLDAYPVCWPIFAAECFARFETFRAVRDGRRYVAMLASAPTSVSFLHGQFRAEVLLTQNGPTEVAQRVEAADLCDARDELAALEFKPQWEYTAIVLALWAWMRAKRGVAASAFWDALTSDPRVQAMLLAPVQGSNQSWFSPVPRPAGYRSSKTAQAVFLSSLFRSKGLQQHWGELTEKLLGSELGDPRIPPISEGWERLQKFDASSYAGFLESLISEDLEMFFQHAMSDARRERFWKRYLKSIRRTVCALDRATHQNLTALLGAADPKLAGAMTRARTFTKKSGAHAFCLFFDSIVVVEFSELGNAAYVYKRAMFDRLFDTDLRLNRVTNHNALKDQDSAYSRILHQGANWEDSAADKLEALDIHVDRKR